MADRFVIAAGGNFSATGTWSATDGGAGGASVPTAADNACLSNQSGNLVVDAASVCLDFDCSRGTGYTGTVSGSATLAVSGNLIIKGTWTYTGALTMNATSGTKNVTSNGVTFSGVLAFNGIGGTFSLVDNLALSLNSSTQTIRLLNGTFLHNNKKVTFSGGGPQGVSGAITFFDVDRIGTSALSCSLVLNANITIAGTFKYLGNSGSVRLLIQSDVIGTPRTITAAAIDAASDFCDFMDITGAGAAAPFATGSRLGDCQGNSGITFTTPATQTATGTASFTWSTHGWTSRVPLPQDDVVIPNAFIAGRTITADMPRLGKSITFSCTGNPTLTPGTNPTEIFGSVDLTGITMGASGNGYRLNGRGSYTFKMGGTAWSASNPILTLRAPGGTYTQQDALSIGGLFVHSNGTWDSNDFNFTASGFTDNGSTATKSIVMRSSIWTATGTNAWNYSSGGASVTPGTSTIKFTNNTASVTAIAGGGFAYNNIWFDGGASSGAFQMSGSNTFANFQVTAGRTLQFNAGTTTTVTTWTVVGTAGNLVTIGSTTAASHTLTKSGGGIIGSDFISISRSTASPGTTWYAGANSTDGGNNSGWIFTGGVVSASDSGVGTDALATIGFAVIDAGSGADAVTDRAIGVLEAGVGGDVVTDRALAFIDPAAGADAALLSGISFAVLDAGVGTDAITDRGIAFIDTAVGHEFAANSAFLQREHGQFVNVAEHRTYTGLRRSRDYVADLQRGRTSLTEKLARNDVRERNE